MAEERRYDCWAGNTKGIPEDKTRCVEEVTDFTGWHPYQCSRKRGYGPDGLYCRQHAKRLERIQRHE
jgi:hypothetical protein